MEKQVYLINGRLCVKDEIGNCIPVQFSGLGIGGGGKGRPGNPGPQGPQGASGAFPYGNDIGVANAYKVSGLGVTKTQGQTFEIKISNSNLAPGPSTIEVDGYGALPFVDTDLNPFQPDDIEADSVYLVTYNEDAGGIGIEGWQLLGLAKPVEAINPLTNVLFVDKNTATGTPDGSIAQPYTTIQAALNSIPTPSPVDFSGLRKVWNIVISPDTYDEELTVDITRKKIVLTSWGNWNLGVFDLTNWLPSGTRRNINIVGDETYSDGIRNGLTIMSYNSVGQRYSTNQSYQGGCRISGAIILDVSGNASLELDFQAEVFGTTGDSTGDSLYVKVGAVAPNPITQLYLYNGRWHGKITPSTLPGPSACNFQHAENVRFGGLVTTPNYSLIKFCRFDKGMIVSGGSAGLFPQGIINTYFAVGSIFTGTARIDGNTNYWMKANLVVPTIKIIQDDLVP